MKNAGVPEGQISLFDMFSSSVVDLPLDWDAFSDAGTGESADADGGETKSAPDALILSLTTRGRVDIEFMSSVTGMAPEDVTEALRGSIYQNPETWDEDPCKGWETADEYLSGNLIRKWNAAKQADKKYGGCFRENISAIDKVMPPTVATEDIYITLGSPWVPADVIDDFITHLFGEPFPYWASKRYKEVMREAYKTKHDELTGTWEIPEKSRFHHSVAVSQKWGTERMEALTILEKTLNMKTVSVTDEVNCPTNASGKKRVINKTETLAAIEKQQKLIRKFQSWVFKDSGRKDRLETIFAEKYGSVKRRIFDGSFLEFPGMSDEIRLFPYQKDAVARILFTPNTLLAHDVGAGKTYVMIAAGQELKRMGLSDKNMYVVPNNIVGQWEKIFLSMYPDAKLLCVEPKLFKPEKRRKTLERMRDEDFDGIIIAYSCFEQIPLSRAFYREDLAEQKRIAEQKALQKNKATSALKRKCEKLSAALSELALTSGDAGELVFFDELGITRLFIDEAHNFKNVPIETKTDRVLGIRAAGSKKCRDMMDKVHLVQKRNGGKGVVMATGTPITNSVTDAYIMQSFLQEGELAMLDLQNFDSWVGMFAERRTEFEIDVDTSSYRLATRFAKFHNLPELTSLLSMIADFHPVDASAGVPEHDGYQDTMVIKTRELTDYLKTISRRADDVRTGAVGRTEDNMLKITTDGRKAALDLRLVDRQAGYISSSKCAKCAENVADIYFKTKSQKSTQLIFCDISTPKAGFNIYDELKVRLMSYGIPGDEIAFIHDAESEAKRPVLFR